MLILQGSYLLVSIIIVNYKDYDMTIDCLESIKNTTYSNYEVIVVDNDYDEDRLAELKAKFKQFRFIGSRENLYYAGGNNLGINESKGELIVLLNNDTKVSPSWLDPLVDMARKEPLAFYQPKILFMDNPSIVNSMGDTMNIFGFAFPIDIGKHENQTSEQNREVFFCSGACVLTSREVIKKIGSLDANFYNYYEDVNWGWRGHLTGIKSYVIPSSVIYHKWGGSYSKELSSKKLFYLERGRASSIIRNYSLKTIIVLLPSLIIIDLALLLFCLKKGLFRYKMAAMIDVWKNLGTLMKERKALQSNRKIADSELFYLMSRKINHPYFDQFVAGKRFLERLSDLCFKFL